MLRENEEIIRYESKVDEQILYWIQAIKQILHPNEKQVYLPMDFE